MKRIILVPLIIVLAVGLVFSGCAEPAPTGPQEILVGSVVSLTGHFAAFGEGGIFGVEAAVEDINKLGGVFVKEFGRKIPIKLIVVDSESDPLKAGSLAEDMCTRDKVHFLAPPLESMMMRPPIATIADRYKIPNITSHGPLEPWQGIRKEVEPPWQYTWSTGFSIATPPVDPRDFRNKPGYTIIDTWVAMLDLFGGQTNKIAGVFASDDSGGIAWYRSFPKELEKAGYEVIGVEKDLGLAPMATTDFTSIIEEWKANDVEVLWGNSPAPMWGTMWRQAKTLHFQPKMVSASRAALFYQDIAAWGGDLPHGVGIEIWWDPSYEGCPGIGGRTPQSLFERWVEETGQPLNPNIGMGYSIIQILIDAIERAGTLDADKVVKAIGETDMMTICHRVLFEKETHFSRVPLTYGQWYKTDKPEVWELKIVFSEHDFIKTTGEPIFPIPYK